jgi:hypothetical protein
MGCQRNPAPAPRRVRLTDQALVAVAIARRLAAAGHGRAPAVDLVAGLAVEPDGVASQLLRGDAPAALALAEPAAGGAPHAAAANAPAALEALVGAAADAAGPRPPGTVDLLRACLDDGADELGALLDRCGLDRTRLRADVERASGATRLWTELLEAPAAIPAELAAAVDGLFAQRSLAAETFGLGAAPAGEALSPSADLVVARTRALAGGALALVLLAAALDDGDVRGLLPGDPSALVRALGALYGRHAQRPATASWDAGVDAVVDAARRWRAPHAVSLADLVRAAATAGGAGPLALLEEARRRSPEATGR